MDKLDFVSDESKYAFKCLDCGAQLTEDDLGSGWDKLSLDMMERWSCPKCENNYEYYYSLDCIQAYDGDFNQTGALVFTNKVGVDKVEITSAEGIFEEMKKGQNL